MQLSFDMGESAEKVVAVTEIPRGARSCNLLVEKSADSMGIKEEMLNFPVQVGMWTNGKIQPLNTSNLPCFWPKLIKIAPDCHDQNIKMSRVNSSEIVLQATKDIPEGQELLMWFAEDILIDELRVPPYLNPGNIRGGNSYVCQCGKEFEAPNNLKIHIALKCNSLPKSVLWHRLMTCSSNTSPASNSSSPSHFSHLNQLSQNHQHQPIVPLPILMPPHGISHLLPQSRPSTIIRPFEVQLSPPEIAPTSPNNHVDIPSNNNNNNGSMNGRSLSCVEKSLSVSDPQAQLESIVSNMGKARNGHMCLYCGKLYSRKYGLKIHIRTHTGYKPLRCRICHRPFGDPSNLNKHIRLHSDGNTPYRCDICNKVLVRKRDLERHIRSRHTNSVSGPEEIVFNGSTLNGRNNPSH